MNTATAAAVGTSLEVLAPYLPYGIALQTPLQPARTLSGLHGGDEPSASCKTADGWDSSIGLEYIKPILRDFSQLTVPLPTGEVPAVEVAKLELEYPEHFDWASAVVMQMAEMLIVSVDLPGYPKKEQLYIHADWDCLNYKQVNWLRKHHFAVGLEPHQFIEAAPSTSTREADNTATS